jgi:CheY-like chemotaxis protein
MTKSGNRPLILIVDDNEDIRHVLRAAMEGFGFEVAEATDGQDALTIALNDVPDLILMDLSMAPFDGFAAINRIRRHVGLQNIPVVCVSAHTAPEIRGDALTAGFDSFISKPVNFQELHNVIDELLFTRGP